MDNVWIVVPVTSNEVDLTSFVNKLSGNYTAPEKFSFEKFNSELNSFEKVEEDHPHAGEKGPSIKDRIILVNMKDGYSKYDGAINVESFGEISIPRLMNVGISYAQNNNAEKIFVLSNPCDFDTFILSEAINKLNSNKVVNISDGAAFLLNGDTDFRLDESLRVWYWSEDLYKTMENKTNYYRSDFMFFNELIPLIVNTEELNSIVSQDKDIFYSKWS